MLRLYCLESLETGVSEPDVVTDRLKERHQALARASPALKRATLVTLTGYGQPEDRGRALAAGFDSHLVKPVNPDELLQVASSFGQRCRDPEPTTLH